MSLLGELVGGLDLGSASERREVRQLVEGFLERQGYPAEITSIRDGVLTLSARPAEAYLLRMDETALLRVVEDAELTGVVRSVRIRCAA